MKYAPNIRRKIFTGFLLSFLILGGALLFIQREIVTQYLVRGQLKQYTVIGNNIIKSINSRLTIAEVVATSIANTAQIMPKDDDLFKSYIPELLKQQGYEFLIAGGGYWPEPNAFLPDVERHSFFWGREADGHLKFFDDYNLPEGNGYHHEEWYVPARYADNKGCYWSKSYVDPYSGQPMVTCTIPAFAQNSFIGVSTVDLKLEGLGELLKAAIKDGGGYGFIVDRNNKFIYHPDTEGTVVGGDAESVDAKEKLDVDAYAERNPLFAQYRDVLSDMNKRILNYYTSTETEQLNGTPGTLEKQLAGDSYQINEKEAALIAALLRAPRQEKTALDGLLQPERHEYADDPYMRQPVYVDAFLIPDTNWKVVLVTPKAHIEAQVNNSVVVLLKYTLAIILGCFLVFFASLQTILFYPLRRIVVALKSGKEGDVAFLDETKNNEVGEIAYWYNQRTSQMVEARRAAEEANSAKSNFLANMSHELRTPLNSIIGMGQLINRKKLDQETAEMFGSIVSSSRTLLATVNDILDLSKIEAGEVELEKTPFDAMEEVKSCVQALKPLASEKGLTLSYKGPEEPVPVMGDRLRYTRILTNMISNAVRYTIEGGVRVHVRSEKTEDGRVRVHCEVIDTGIGIEKHMQDAIFDKFTQADSSISRKFGGTGLGLAITKELVEMMGGKITVESEPGKGSIFSFDLYFDVADQESVTLAANDIMGQTARATGVILQSGRIPVAKARLLVAEDHAMNQLLIRKILGSIGLEYYTVVENGREAVETLKSGRFDLVLMDCHMPEMNGYDAARAIRDLKDPFKCNIPIIATTANNMKDDEKRCFDAGMNSYVSKPIEISELKQKMSAWIDFTDHAEKAKAHAGTPDSEILDMNGLKTLAGGDEDFIRYAAELFATQSALHVSALKKQATDGENHEWVDIAHTLKDAAGNVQAEGLRLLCARAQDMRKASAASRQAIAEEIAGSFTLVRAELVRLGYLKE